MTTKQRHGDVKRTKYDYQMIDGTWTHYPVAYCHRYKGVLTRNMMNTHKCNERNCHKLDKDCEFE